MTEDEIRFVNQLAARVEELERQVEHLGSHEPDTTLEEMAARTERQIFSHLVRYLELTVPTFSMEEFREYSMNGTIGSFEAAAKTVEHGEFWRSAFRQWLDEIISEMLPEPYPSQDDAS